MASDQIVDTFLEDSNFIIIKGRFKSSELNLYGLFLIVFNNSGTIDSSNIVVSTYSSIYNLEPHNSWDRFEESILDLKWKGNHNTSLTSSLMDQLKSVSSDSKLRADLYSSAGAYDYDNVEIILSDLIYRIVHDKNLQIEIGIQEVSREEFKSSREKEKKSEPPATDQKKDAGVEDGSVVLPLQPILAPVKGKPLYELKIGDKIVAKIVANSDRENYFIDLLDLRVEDRVRPVPCEVIDIKANSREDPIEILTQIGPGIYGRMLEDERQVKLRMYDPAVDGPMTKKTIDVAQAIERNLSKSGRREGGLSRISYLIIGLFALLMLIFIILVLISM